MDISDLELCLVSTAKVFPNYISFNSIFA